MTFSPTTGLTAALRATAICVAALSLPAHGAVVADAVPNPAPTAGRYVWRNVVIGGGGFVTGVEFHPQARGLAYARTDVGGAYRWDSAAKQWIPLLDWLGRPEWNHQGVESLALDPEDPQRVYLAVGTYTFAEASHGLILRSRDQGRTWQRTMMPFKFGANEAGRNSGERLAVDPHAGHILFLGTRRDGLWRSTDHGATWARVTGFPDLPDDSSMHQATPGTYNELAQPVGIIRVAFDSRGGRAGEPTPVMYAALSRAAGGIFRSTDAGETWTLMPGQPTGLRPTALAIAADGRGFVAYGDRPGPNEMRDGAVWTFAPEAAEWKDITPQRPARPDDKEGHFGYAAVGVDPADPQTLVVSTWNRWKGGDEIFRSIDGGRTWRPMFKSAKWDHASAPYIRTLTPHWISDVEIDPFDPDRMIFTTGYGLWSTANATAADRGERTDWIFANRGLEETVPHVLVSPPAGAPLVSGLADVDGFRHEDLAVSPSGRFPGPRLKSTTWLDFAAARPEIMVRAGVTYKMDRRHGAWSDDGAATWQAFASAPPPAGGREFGTGPIAISADGAVILWTTHGNIPHLTRNRGETWEPVEGAPIDLVPVADRTDPKRFHGYDPRAGALYSSTDGGRTFSKRRGDLPVPPPRREGPLQAELRSVPGRPGELWFAARDRLFHGADNDAQWTEVAAVRAVSSVGLGKAAPGADYPAVYIAAAIGDDDGLFRSDDAGRTWIKISDDLHRFGSARALTGDPRIFGRVYFATGGRGIVYGEPAK